MIGGTVIVAMIALALAIGGITFVVGVVWFGVVMRLVYLLWHEEQRPGR